VRSEELKARLAAAGELVSWPDALSDQLGVPIVDSRKAERGALFIAYAGTTTR
jgi:hypothetical protein